jgi:hypothetical protein
VWFADACAGRFSSAGKSDARMLVSGTVTTSRSMVLRSCRTLPGQRHIPNVAHGAQFFTIGVMQQAATAA